MILQVYSGSRGPSPLTFCQGSSPLFSMKFFHIHTWAVLPLLWELKGPPQSFSGKEL